MIPIFDYILLIFLIVAAVISLKVKDLLSASMVFGIYRKNACRNSQER